MKERKNSRRDQKRKSLFDQIRYWAGYALFFIAVAYSIYQAPTEICHLNFAWLPVAIISILGMLGLEISQFFVFLHQHHIKSGLLIPTQFTLRKSVMNSILPAKTGTLLFLQMVNKHYKLEWHNYIRFMIVATIIMFGVSIMAAGSLLLPGYLFAIVISIVMLISVGARLLIKESYFRQSALILIVGFGLYVSRLFIFWSLLNGMELNVGLVEASYFAIATNTLAQIPITPGNIGIREILFGLMSPYISLSMSAGILVGALFQVLRIIIYTVIMFSVDILCGNAKNQAR